MPKPETTSSTSSGPIVSSDLRDLGVEERVVPVEDRRQPRLAVLAGAAEGARPRVPQIQMPGAIDAFVADREQPRPVLVAQLHGDLAAPGVARQRRILDRCRRAPRAGPPATAVARSTASAGAPRRRRSAGDARAATPGSNSSVIRKPRSGAAGAVTGQPTTPADTRWLLRIVHSGRARTALDVIAARRAAGRSGRAPARSSSRAAARWRRPAGRTRSGRRRGRRSAAGTCRSATAVHTGAGCVGRTRLEVERDAALEQPAERRQPAVGDALRDVVERGAVDREDRHVPALEPGAGERRQVDGARRQRPRLAPAARGQREADRGQQRQRQQRRADAAAAPAERVVDDGDDEQQHRAQRRRARRRAEPPPRVVVERQLVADEVGPHQRRRRADHDQPDPRQDADAQPARRQRPPRQRLARDQHRVEEDGRGAARRTAPAGRRAAPPSTTTAGSGD